MHRKWGRLTAALFTSKPDGSIFDYKSQMLQTATSPYNAFFNVL